jgi:hypothetical protein
MYAWPMRMGADHLTPLCPCVWDLPMRWRAAAAAAAAEMAIVCHIWPDQLDEVLRPARTL